MTNSRPSSSESAGGSAPEGIEVATSLGEGEGEERGEGVDGRHEKDAHDLQSGWGGTKEGARGSRRRWWR